MEKRVNCNIVDDDIPDLEDFSQEFNRINDTKGNNFSKSVPIKVEVIETSSKTNTNEINSNNNKQDYEFGMGLKKGFLKKSQQNNPQTTNNDNITDLTNVKAKKNKLEIEEVQK